MDHYYSYPEERIREIREAKPWMADAKYFKKVKISPSACIKMLTHGQSGVEKGISQNGKPVEVMGLLLGRPDTDDLQSMIISDAIPMPCEGFETRVVVEDENVINYMIEMGESIEFTRHERFCGWYHTHPFDLDGTSHCYLSNTDVTTQLQWQRSEDKHGNHWLAIVIDPLLSLEQSKPEMMAFRVFPPEYTAGRDETPDGKHIKEERVRVEKWGACWNRYYRLEIEYFMSSLAQETLGIIRNKFLWPKTFQTPAITSATSSGSMISSIAHRLDQAAGKREAAATSQLRSEVQAARDEQQLHDPSDITFAHEKGTGGSSGSGSSNEWDIKGLQRTQELSKEVAGQHACSMCNLLLKKLLFCLPAEGVEESSNNGGGVDEMSIFTRMLLNKNNKNNYSKKGGGLMITEIEEGATGERK